MDVETFSHEIQSALRVYDKYVVCLDKTPDDLLLTLNSLVTKAIRAYENRGPHLRHGIALDRQVTVILSQTDGPRPLCGIYFNLFSPYQKPPAGKATKTASEDVSEGDSQASGQG